MPDEFIKQPRKGDNRITESTDLPYLKKLADSGDLRAACRIGVLCLRGIGVKKSRACRKMVRLRCKAGTCKGAISFGGLLL